MHAFGVDPLDTWICEAEPVRFTGAVQHRGALLMADPVSITIETASESCREIVGMHASELLGRWLSHPIGIALKNELPTGDGEARQPLPCPKFEEKTFTARSLLDITGQLVIDIDAPLCTTKHWGGFRTTFALDWKEYAVIPAAQMCAM